MTREFRALANTTPASLLAGPFDPTLDPMLLSEDRSHPATRSRVAGK